MTQIGALNVNAAQDQKMKILLLVEPTPFNYVSGYANRFKEMLHHLKRRGNQVEVITPDPDPNHPTEFEGFPITTLKGFKFPWYNQVSLSFDTRFKTKKVVQAFRPDIIHVSTPSVLVFSAILWARLFKIPLVMSYHTDIVEYAKTYLPVPGIETMAKYYIRMMLYFADLVLCTSPQLKAAMEAVGIRRVDVWQKGINTEVST